MAVTSARRGISVSPPLTPETRLALGACFAFLLASIPATALLTGLHVVSVVLLSGAAVSVAFLIVLLVLEFRGANRSDSVPIDRDAEDLAALAGRMFADAGRDSAWPLDVLVRGDGFVSMQPADDPAEEIFLRSDGRMAAFRLQPAACLQHFPNKPAPKPSPDETKILLELARKLAPDHRSVRLLPRRREDDHISANFVRLTAERPSAHETARAVSRLSPRLDSAP